ncbi:MAG: hypothetical protein K0U38_12125, partial [Epsilonproteobacteria bacterium]|nr:hypothetical protein [Campylobacterota bacterium]
KLKNIFLIGILLLFIPILSIAEEAKPSESMDIRTLIEKAKEASPEDRIKIEDLIKKKIAKAHRENYLKG